jgi:hypothetical protein
VAQITLKIVNDLLAAGYDDSGTGRGFIQSQPLRTVPEAAQQTASRGEDKLRLRGLQMNSVTLGFHGYSGYGFGLFLLGFTSGKNR